MRKFFIRQLALIIVLSFVVACGKKKSLHEGLGPDEDGTVSLDLDDEDMDDSPIEIPQDLKISPTEKKLIKSYLKTDESKVSFIVVDAASLKAVRSHQSLNPRTMASLAKIITALGALENVKNIDIDDVAYMLKKSHNGKASKYVRRAAYAIDKTKVKGSPYTAAASCPSQSRLSQELPAARSVFGWLKKETDGVDWRQADFQDGAGCSYQNKMSPYQLIQVLYYADLKGPKYHGRSFEKLLSIAGRDGTWRGRNKSHRGRILAKTGTLYVTSNLAGYFYARRDGKLHKYYFVIYASKPKGSSQTPQARSLLEALLRHWIKIFSASKYVA